MGEYEPDDSRNVTGAGSGAPEQQGVRSPGGADQQLGQPRWNGDGQPQQGNSQQGNLQQGQAGQDQSQGQQQQFQQGGGQMSGGSGGTDMSSQIREHMEVIGADGVHIGTVDDVEGDRIKLTKKDSDAGIEGGTHSGHHHYLSIGLVAEVEGDRVRLSANGDVAWGMLEEQ